VENVKKDEFSYYYYKGKSNNGRYIWQYQNATSSFADSSNNNRLISYNEQSMNKQSQL
jgi:hypothetical protein